MISKLIYHGDAQIKIVPKTPPCLTSGTAVRRRLSPFAPECGCHSILKHDHFRVHRFSLDSGLKIDVFLVIFSLANIVDVNIGINGLFGPHHVGRLP